MTSHSNSLSSFSFSSLWWDIATQLCPPIASNQQWLLIIDQLYKEFGSTIVLSALQTLYAKKRCALAENPVTMFSAYLHAICNNKRKEVQTSAKTESSINTQSYIYI